MLCFRRSRNTCPEFPAALYTLENFRAATEVWNAYGMTVQGEEVERRRRGGGDGGKGGAAGRRGQ